MNKKKLTIILALIILLGLAFWAGWYYRNTNPPAGKFCRSAPLTLGGYEFVKPLLVCDTSTEKDKEFQPLKNELTNLLSQQEKGGSVSQASIYFQDFNTSGRIDINPDKKFDAASMGKIPVMIAFFKMAETDPNILDEKITDTNKQDLNADQAIKPKEYAKFGQTYAVSDLINKMIKYSDNNSLYLLASIINPDTFKTIYGDLQLPISLNQKSSSDNITTADVSYFFRILYNGTYLTTDLSDEALKILSETNFNDDLVAGVPKGIAVSHKFGSEKIGNEQQLHDCGIIYHSKNPYLLCIMTKSSSDIAHIETAIKNISSAVYQFENDR